MENQRETKELEVQGHKFIMNTYVTGRDLREIESAMLTDIQVTQRGEEQEMSGFNSKMLEARQDAKIKAVVVSIDGKTENIIDLVLDLPAPIYNEVMVYVNELTEPKKEEAGNENQ